MSLRFGRLFENAFWVWGWLCMASTGVGAVAHFYLTFFLSDNLHQLFGVVFAFPLLKEFTISSATFAQGALALLVASLLQTIRLKKAETLKGRPRRLATVTSAAFVTNGVLGILFAMQTLTLAAPTGTGALYFYQIFVLFFGFAHLLTPFFYAALVFLVYRHLAEWITLESELV